MGLVAGALGALASLLIPGFGLVIGGGALATALATAAGTTAAGAVAGGLAGFLQDQGVDSDAANDYAETVNRGGALIELRLPSNNVNSMEAEQILNKYGASNIRSGAGTLGTTGAMTQTQGIADTHQVGTLHTQQQNVGTLDNRSADMLGTQSIPVVEEELMVGKREVETGRAQVQKVITEKPVQENINLREEHITVERTPVNRAATAADIDNFQEGTFELRETKEEAVVSKQARVVEEVTIGKQVSEHTETINDTVRRTDVKVSEFDNDFQTDYKTRFSGGQFAGRNYNEFQPAYHYGHELANDTRYSNSDWTGVENNARGEWATRNSTHKWDDVKDAVRYGYDRTRTGMSNRI